MKQAGKRRKSETLLNIVMSDAMHDIVKELREKIMVSLSKKDKEMGKFLLLLKEKDEQLEQIGVDSNTLRKELLSEIDSLKMGKQNAESLLMEAAECIHQLKEGAEKYEKTLKQSKDQFLDKLAKKENEVKLHNCISTNLFPLNCLNVPMHICPTPRMRGCPRPSYWRLCGG